MFHVAFILTKWIIVIALFEACQVLRKQNLANFTFIISMCKYGGNFTCSRNVEKLTKFQGLGIVFF